MNKKARASNRTKKVRQVWVSSEINPSRYKGNLEKIKAKTLQKAKITPFFA